MKLQIESVINGYILTTEEESLDGNNEPKPLIRKFVYQERYNDEEDEAEKECAVEMLKAVQEYFEVPWSKHHEKNIKIELTKDW